MDEFTAYAALSLDQLFEKLADSSTVGGLPFDRKQKVSVGRALFEAWFDRVRADLCGKYVNLPGGDQPEDVAKDAAAIADALLALTGQMPLATLSVITAKYGLDALCAGST